MNFFDKALNKFNSEWALISAGNIENFNAMTISWGGLGTLWNKKVCTVYVKPCRYTHEFMENNEYFTVSFFDEKYKKELSFLGSKSGRDLDKVKESGLSPKTYKGCVMYLEAKVTLLCKKIYRQDLDVKNMPSEVVEKHYVSDLPHTMYIGEVIDVLYEDFKTPFIIPKADVEMLREDKYEAEMSYND